MILSFYRLLLIFFAFVFLLGGCVQNGLYRTGAKKECFADQCTQAVIEEHGGSEDYALAFVEFSERGNAFDREKMTEVLDYITQQEKDSENGVMVLVYVHGWHNNAGNSVGGDVREFRKILKVVSKNDRDDRKVVGVYIGWRGESLNLRPVNLITYWGRKNTAHQVGNGGVTELLLKLDKITKGKRGEYNRNIFVVTGHSFGAALVLAAMKDTLLNKLVDAEHVEAKHCGMVKAYRPFCSAGCSKSESFGDGIVLVNPAVEANELMQIHELITETRCYSRNQPKLLHVVSTDRDWANKTAFRVGQFIGVSLLDKEAVLTRRAYTDNLNKRSVIAMSETDLDTNTIGNFFPFRTGKQEDGNYYPCHSSEGCLGRGEKNEYGFQIASPPFSPVSIIYGDKVVSKGHNDVFNNEIISYIATSIFENKYKKNPMFVTKEVRQGCIGSKDQGGVDRFLFKECHDFFRNFYSRDLPVQK